MEAQKEKKISVSRRVMNAILKLQESKGVSLVNLKKYLRDEKNLDIDKYNEEIKLALKSGLDRDMLIRKNGMYKVKEAKRGGDKSAKVLDGRGETSQKSSVREKAARKRAPTGASREKAARKRTPTGASRKKAPVKCDCVMCS